LLHLESNAKQADFPILSLPVISIKGNLHLAVREEIKHHLVTRLFPSSSSTGSEKAGQGFLCFKKKII
jgi:hypothetical protein